MYIFFMIIWYDLFLHYLIFLIKTYKDIFKIIITIALYRLNPKVSHLLLFVKII